MSMSAIMAIVALLVVILGIRYVQELFGGD